MLKLASHILWVRDVCFGLFNIFVRAAASSNFKQLMPTQTGKKSMHYAGRLIDSDMPKFSASHFVLNFFYNLCQFF